MRRAAPGSLESAVLDVLWDDGGWLTPGEVQQTLGVAHPVSYMTVMTVLVRLWKKEGVERRKAGRAFAYRPVLSREKHVARRMDLLLAAVTDRPTALSHFVELLGEDERGQLARALGAQGDS